MPVAFTLMFFSDNLIFVWTGSTMAAQKSGLAASLLIGGQLMQTITVIPYYLALAHGDVKLNIKIGIASIVLITPLLILLTNKFGIEGAGMSWLVMNICTLPPYMYFLHRRFLPGEFKRWCLHDIGKPLLVALACVLIGYWFVPHTGSKFLTLIFIGLVWFMCFAITVATASEIRNALIAQVKKLLMATASA